MQPSLQTTGPEKTSTPIELTTPQIPLWLLFFLSVLLAFLLVPLLSFPLQTDQTHFAYLSFLWVQGYSLYSETQTHQWPGQFLLFYGLFWCFGSSEWIIRFSDFVLQWIASLTFFFLVARLSHPFWGALASVGFAVSYISLGDWHTSNRETYQIALFLPVLWWLFFSSFSERTETFFAFCCGLLTAFSLSIKPTTGLLLFVLIAVIWFSDSPFKREHRKKRLLFFGAGLFCFAFGILAVFWKQLPAVYESIFLFNLHIYSKIPYSINLPPIPSTHPVRDLAILAHDLAYNGFYLSFLVLFFAHPSLRKKLFFLFLAHLACLLAVLVQAKGLFYHRSLLAPFALLWPILLLAQCFSFARDQRQKQRYLRSLVGVGGCCLVLAFHWPTVREAIKTHTWPPYKAAFMPQPPKQLAQSNEDSWLLLHQAWNEAYLWLKKNVKKTESVFVYGLHDGLQFKARLKPMSRVTRGVLAYWKTPLNQHPIVQKQIRQWLADLKRSAPDWFLVAAYDVTWIAHNGLESLLKLPVLEQFLMQNYVFGGTISVEKSPESQNRNSTNLPSQQVLYLVYKRKQKHQKKRIQP